MTADRRPLVSECGVHQRRGVAEGYHGDHKPMSHNPGRAARSRRGATEVDSATEFRPGQIVAVEAAASGNFDGVAQGTVQKADEFGSVVRRYLCGKSVRPYEKEA